MIKTDEFRDWLKNNTSYNNDVIRDTISRIRRADRIKEWNDTETYLFYIQKEPDFLELSTSVRSQIRKAIKLYFEFIKSTN